MAGLGLPPEHPRVWGIQVGRVKGGEAKVSGLLDLKDDDTATTAMLTDAEDAFTDSDTESDDGEDYAAENSPRPPPDDLMYGGDGESRARRRDVTQVDDRGGQPNCRGTQRAEARTHEAVLGIYRESLAPRTDFRAYSVYRRYLTLLYRLPATTKMVFPRR